MIRFLALMAVFLGCAVAPALAQEGARAPEDAFDSPAFQAFLTSEYADRLRREALQRSMILHQPACVEVPRFELLGTWPVTPITISEGDVAPTTGVWRERLISTACEETATENLVHTFTSEGQRTFLLVRGTTEADLDTQLALINEARDVAATDDDARGCDIIRFTDTSIANRYGDGRWLEHWTANACGEDVVLDIMFQPHDGEASTYEITPGR